MNSAANRGGDVHKRVEREARHPATQQVIHARLGDSTVSRGLGLRPAVLFDNGRNLTDKESGVLATKRYLIIDRDTTYSEGFRELVEQVGRR